MSSLTQFKQNYLNDAAYLITKYVNHEQFNILTAKQSQYFPHKTSRSVYLNPFELENSVIMSLKHRSLLSLIFTFAYKNLLSHPLESDLSNGQYYPVDITLSFG